MKDRKEEILKANHAKLVMNWENVFVQNPLIIESAYKSMEQYAEEMAVGFANYILNDVSKSFYDSSLTITTNNDYYQQYIESIPQPSK